MAKTQKPAPTTAFPLELIQRLQTRLPEAPAQFGFIRLHRDADHLARIEADPNQNAAPSVAVIYGTVAVVIASAPFDVAGAAAVPTLVEFERLSYPRKLSRPPRSDLTFAVSHPDGTSVHDRRNEIEETAR